MNNVSVATLFVRLVVSLGVVLMLMTFAARALNKSKSLGGRRRTGRGGASRRRTTTTPVEIVGRQSLGRRSSVVLVRTANRGLVLGVTEANIHVLAETTVNELLVPDEPEPAAAKAVAIETIAIEPSDLEAGGRRALPAGRTTLLDQIRERTIRKTA
jgi:flagellar protein FliO/FliZ